MTGHPSGDFAEASHVLPTHAGLSSAEAAHRLAMDGPNRLPARDRSPVPLLLLREMVHFFALLLWAAAGLALLAGMPQLAVAIVVVVLLNGAFAQEYRADQAGRRLRELIPASAPARGLGPGRLGDPRPHRRRRPAQRAARPARRIEGLWTRTVQDDRPWLSARSRSDSGGTRTDPAASRRDRPWLMGGVQNEGIGRRPPDH